MSLHVLVRKSLGLLLAVHGRANAFGFGRNAVQNGQSGRLLNGVYETGIFRVEYNQRTWYTNRVKSDREAS